MIDNWRMCIIHTIWMVVKLVDVILETLLKHQRSIFSGLHLLGNHLLQFKFISKKVDKTRHYSWKVAGTLRCTMVGGQTPFSGKINTPISIY